MKNRRFDSFSEFYDIPTPIEAPLRAGLDNFHRMKTWPICRKCGQAFPKNKPVTIQIPRFAVSSGIVHPVTLPHVGDEKIMTQFMLFACEKGVGCWTSCRCGKSFNQKCINNCVLRGVGRPGDCDCICSCRVGCGNKKRYPCACGYTRLLHRKACPVGDYKRDSSFVIGYMRSQMIGTRGRS